MNGRLRSLVLCLTALAVLALMYTQILPIIQERLSPTPTIRTGHSSTNTVPAVRATARIQNNLILTVKRASGETETIVNPIPAPLTDFLDTVYPAVVIVSKALVDLPIISLVEVHPLFYPRR